MTEPTQTDQPDLGLVEVNTLDDFAQYLMQWHGNKVAQAKHMLEVPLNTDIEFEGATITLEGERLQAFKAGLTTALAIFQEIPFAFSTEEEPDDQRSESDTSSN